MFAPPFLVIQLFLNSSPYLRAEIRKCLDCESVGVELAKSVSHKLEDGSASCSTKKAKALRHFLIGHLGYAQMSDYLDELSSPAVDITRKPSECRLIALATDRIPERFESC